jgi:hypothetical protein
MKKILQWIFIKLFLRIIIMEKELNLDLTLTTQQEVVIFFEIYDKIGDVVTLPEGEYAGNNYNDVSDVFVIDDIDNPDSPGGFPFNDRKIVRGMKPGIASGYIYFPAPENPVKINLTVTVTAAQIESDKVAGVKVAVGEPRLKEGL